MTVEIGHYALVLALCVASALALLPTLELCGFFGFSQNNGAETTASLASKPTGATKNSTSTNFDTSPIAGLARPLAGALFLLCLFSSAMLIRAFLLSDFSVLLVWQNSHSQKPDLYKFAALWGNHEGSMLLWVVVLSAFAAMIAFFSRASRLMRLTLAIQSGICALFLAFTLFFSNPFARLYPAALDGQGLNPILQHPALAIHPPLLYLGYVGLSAAFSATLAGLILNELHIDWAKSVRVWTLVAWSFLGAGITLGAFWAYEELGWGGFWFWDPVENASLMPWLLASAGLHALMSYIKTGRLLSWAILLVLLAFSASLLGTFLVRSGVLVSVHSFASDPLRGILILLCVSFITGSSLCLFAWRKLSETNLADTDKTTGEPAKKNTKGNTKPSSDSRIPLLSRETGQFFNVLLLSCCCALVMLATLYPLFFEFFTGGTLSVGPPYYASVLTPFFLLLIAILGLLPVLGWGGSSIARIKRHIFWAAPISCGCGLAMIVFASTSATAAIAVALGLWALIGALTGLWNDGFRRRSSRQGRGANIAHAGIAILLIAVACASLTDIEKFRRLSPGERITIDSAFSSSTLELQDIFTKRGANYQESGARFAFIDKEKSLSPSRRVYHPSKIETTEAAIDRNIYRDIYLTIATIRRVGNDQSSEPEDSLSVRIQMKPLMFWVWLGAGITVLGGILSLLPNRTSKGREVV